MKTMAEYEKEVQKEDINLQSTFQFKMDTDPGTQTMEGKDEQSKKTTVHAKNRSKRARSSDHNL